MKILTQPLTAEAFAPFGQVVTAPRTPSRLKNAMRLENRRTGASPALDLVKVAPSTLPLTSRRMERHRFSSQAFVPLDVSRYLVLVAPDKPGGGPDVENVRAFLASATQGVNYNANTWHHPVTVLDRPGDFCVFMWNDGTEADTDWFDLGQPFEVAEGR